MAQMVKKQYVSRNGEWVEIPTGSVALDQALAEGTPFKTDAEGNVDLGQAVLTLLNVIKKMPGGPEALQEVLRSEERGAS